METAKLLELILHMKSHELNVTLNDKNIKPLFDPSDETSAYLQDMTIMFKQIDLYLRSTKVRKLTLTADTSAVLHVEFNGICLTSKLLAELQNDRIEGEFGIYRVLSGGNFHIFIQQVLQFFLLGFTPCKTQQPLRGMELQEKEAQKD